MADVKQAVSAQGFADVETYLQSGNVVFRSAATAERELALGIGTAIREHTGMDVPAMVRSAERWAAIVAANPYPEANAHPKTVHTFLLDGTPEPDRLEALQQKQAGREAWTLAGDTLYLHTPDGFGKSVLGNSIERILKVPMTARNWNTMLALLELAGGTGNTRPGC